MMYKGKTPEQVAQRWREDFTSNRDTLSFRATSSGFTPYFEHFCKNILMFPHLIDSYVNWHRAARVLDIDEEVFIEYFHKEQSDRTAFLREVLRVGTNPIPIDISLDKFA